MFIDHLFGDGGGGGIGIFGDEGFECLDGEFEGVFVGEILGGVFFVEGFVFVVFGFGLFLLLLVLFLMVVVLLGEGMEVEL